MADENHDVAVPLTEHAGLPIARRRLEEAADLDITPMIDVTFLLLIFFLVASTSDVATSVDLPPARYGKGISDRTSVILTVAESGSSAPALVYLADGTAGAPLGADPAAAEEQIAQYVQQGFSEGKPNVLVKAGRGVRHREVSRVAAAAARIEGINMHLAVLEIE